MMYHLFVTYPKKSTIYRLEKLRVATENLLFILDLPIENSEFALLC